MRIFFIPGFGEEPYVFEKIQAGIPGEKVFIDNWSVLNDVPEDGLTVNLYASFLVDRFQIKEADLVIGHSLGAWVALYIKQILGCKIVQIAGWTDSRKVIKLVPNRPLMYWLCRKGWGFNSLTRLLISTFYPDQKAKKLVLAIFDRIKTGNKLITAKQLMIVYNPVVKIVIDLPDIRIHAKKDFIVRPPDEQYEEVPGDHFTLYTYPEAVSKPLVAFMQQQL